jgi:hypothetical protein
VVTSGAPTFKRRSFFQRHSRPPSLTLRGYWPLVFLFSGYLIAKQLAILKILINLKHATDRLQMPSSPRVVK